jgi:hypothetical protein
VFEKLGHDLPDPLIPAIADAIVCHIDSAPGVR